MSPLPPVAATVPGSARKSPMRQPPPPAEVQPCGDITIPAASATTPGDAAAEAAAAALAAPAVGCPIGGSLGSGGRLGVQSPFAASPELLAKKLDAEFGAAADAAAAGMTTPLKPSRRGSGIIGGSLRSVLHPRKALSRALSSRIGDLAPSSF